MCEVGAWKNTEDLEDNLVLDELFELFEKTSDRQSRLIKTIGAAFGAGGSDSDTQSLSYSQGDIAAGSDTLFGYRTKTVEDPGE